jgi:hypothetical protein
VLLDPRGVAWTEQGGRARMPGRAVLAPVTSERRSEISLIQGIP